MPHLIVEYSANIEPTVRGEGLVQAVHDVTAACELFALGGIRTRAIRHETYIIADGATENAFVHITMRLRAGRPADKRQAYLQALFKAASTALEPAFAERPVSLQIQLEENDPELSLRRNTIHDRLGSAGS